MTLEAFGRGVSVRSEASPPSYVKYLPRGEILYAVRSETSPHASSRGRKSAAQRAGLSFQRSVGEQLVAQFGASSVLDSPWFRYRDLSLFDRYCQPDFLVLGPNNCVYIIEVKARWTADAWWQLFRLYLPVLRVAMSNKTLLPVVIARNGVDPAVPCPEKPEVIFDLKDAKPEVFSALVMVW